MRTYSVLLDISLFNVLLWTGTYPLDVVRRRMQMKGATGELFKYNSTWHAFNVIIRTEGLHGLFKGMWPNLLKVTTSSNHIKTCIQSGWRRWFINMVALRLLLSTKKLFTKKAMHHNNILTNVTSVCIIWRGAFIFIPPSSPNKVNFHAMNDLQGF